MTEKPTKIDLMWALRCCLNISDEPFRDCERCPFYENGIDEIYKCAADLLVKIAARMKNDAAPGAPTPETAS